MAKDLQNEGYSSLYRKVAGVDLAAAEARFHERCKSTFYSIHSRWREKQVKPAVTQDPSLGVLGIHP